MSEVGEIVEIERFSDAVAAIYDCAVDPGSWERALELIAGLIGGRTASIGISNAVTRESLIRVSWGVPEPYLSNYSHYVASMPFYTLYAQMGVEEVKAGSAMYDMEEFHASRFYKEWAQPQGLEDVAALCIMNDTKRFGIFGVNIGHDRPLVGPRDLEVLRFLAPHIRRAATISDLLDTQLLASVRIEAALDKLTTGLILVDADLKVRHANQAALSLVSGHDGIQITNDRLQVSAPPAARALTETIRKARDADHELGRAGFNLPVTGRDRRTLILHVLPIGRGQRRSRIDSQSLAAIVLSTPELRPVAPLDALAALYDLSRSETLVLDRIGAGRTPGQAAIDLGLSPATVKSHLARVFRKTGTSRQAELVRITEAMSISLVAAE